MAQEGINLDEKTLVQYCGSYLRPDVFPGKGYPVRIMALGDPTDAISIVDNECRTILYFEIKNNQITSIFSPRSTGEVLSSLSYLPNKRLRAYLKSILKDHNRGRLGDIKIEGISFKPFTEYQNKVIEIERKREKNALEKLLSYNLNGLPISPKSTYSGNLDEVVTIVQKEYAIVSAKKGDKKVANTFGLADCIGLTLYDKDNQVVAVAHIDGYTRVKESISNLLRDLANAGGQKYEARLFGGTKHSAEQFIGLIESLNKPNIKIVEVDILEEAESRNIGISVEGRLYNIFEEINPTVGQRIETSIAMNIPLHCHYKP